MRLSNLVQEAKKTLSTNQLQELSNNLFYKGLEEDNPLLLNLSLDIEKSIPTCELVQ